MGATMQGHWLEEGALSLRDDLPRPSPPPGEALVRVLAAGICNTDLELVRGYYPFRGVLGHEFVGVVEEVSSSANDGSAAGDWVGRRVVGEINAVCGECPTCRAGRPRHCERRTVLGIVDRDGAFADYLTLPVANLHPVPDALSTAEAAFTEPLAAALEITEQVTVDPGQRVLVVGDGKLGQLVARGLALTGCRLTVVGRHPSKLEPLAAIGLATALPEALVDDGFDLAVECTGNPDGFAFARSKVRPRGTLVLKSTYAGELTFDASSVVVDELTLVGSRCGPFPPALELLAGAHVEVASLIDARYPLSRALEAIEHAGRRGALKVLIEIGEER